ncbi:MAG: methylmalonyl-CoA mutase family protein [Alphaproteobacteria bacterium]|nr:methylmalonyl-CoA mutase family protein [Alphaproteobacteria bacterium]
MSETTLQLGEAADEADWRALVEQGLKGASWARLVGKTADGIPLEPLYREPDIHTATDISGMPGAAPYVRGSGQSGWLVRQSFAHPDVERTNAEILADLQGGVGAIELVIDSEGKDGVAINSASDLDHALAGVILEAAPVSLGAASEQSAMLLRDKLKGVAVPGTAFNLDPLGTHLLTGADPTEAALAAFLFTAQTTRDLPGARYLRVDARIVHEAGASEAQEIAYALHSGITYLRGLETRALGIEDSARAIGFAVSVGPDALIEAAKLRALRLCWARVLEASGAGPEYRAAHIHAFTSRRMMTRYDAWTNILRVTSAAFAAAVGGADEITTYPLTDALGHPSAFARRVARNTQHVLAEECRLGHVADPAGGAWFVEKLTREIADRAWSLMQQLQTHAAPFDLLQTQVAEARDRRRAVIATRRETITGVTDFPLLDAALPDFEPTDRRLPAGNFAPIRWAAPFEALRAKAEVANPRVFFATLGTLPEFGPRTQWSRNLFASGGVASVGPEDAYASTDALIDAFRASKTRVAIIASNDTHYAEHAENAAQRLKAAGADWVLLAGKPGDRENALRTAGIDQFVFAGQNALTDLETLHAALGVSA